MRYEHSLERSTECLRAALPLMSKYSTKLHPISYAVWYDYVSGDNPVLKQEVDGYLARQGVLDEVATVALFQKHIAQTDPQTAERFSDGFSRVLSGMAESAALAGHQTAQFGDSLSRLGNSLLDQEPAPILQALQASTREMQQSMSKLQKRLSESQKEIQQLRDEVRQARSDSLIDSLSGLFNRRAFDERMGQWLQQVPAGPASSCLLLADLDHFKRINDTYGHAFGDQVIRAVGQVLKTLVPEQATAARIGGEEFAVLLPTANVQAACDLAEQVRGRIAASRIRRHGQSEAIEGITISFGVAPCRQGDTITSAMERADQALYHSKHAGRDRVSVSAQPG